MVTATTRSGLNTIDRASPGVYLAYPTTEVLKATYYRHQTFVNLSHTKVGIASKSLGSREAEYLRYFNREIVFQPLLQLDPSELRPFEAQLLVQ
jgi:putative ubiquitin-RnfH superfamily antitoxin RatB of RatAB toxin-antitoxin module